MTQGPTAGDGEREQGAEVSVGLADWRPTLQRLFEQGWRFVGLWAAGSDPAPRLRAAVQRGDERRVVICATLSRTYPSIIDLVPGAEWDEREAHDLFGAEFTGHDPMRPLVEHTPDLERWTVPVRGHDPFDVAVGPIHAGIIESGHFRFHVVGERILHLDLRLFYNHRGLERAAAGRSPQEALPYIQRACGADAVTNAVAFAQACEAAGGLRASPRMRRARTVLLELERLYNHLNDIAAISAGVGFAAGTMLFAALKERAQREIERLVGHRFLFDTVAVGASALTIGRSDARQARATLAQLRRDVERGWRELRFAGSVQERLSGVGVVDRTVAERLGAVGPSARAAGIGHDARAHSPGLCYAGFRPVTPAEPTGDVAARLELRGLELGPCLALLDELLGEPLEPDRTARSAPARADAFALVESPRGQTMCAVTLDGGRVARVHLRTGSYANWPLVAHAARGELLPDFPLINKSFELCYACADR